MTILSQAHCPITYHFKIGAIEASQSRNNNRLQVQSRMNQKSFVIAAILQADSTLSSLQHHWHMLNDDTSDNQHRPISETKEHRKW